ncbi:MAG: hypothetical protein R2831_02170 [Chitinophagaceae bacterium]
MQKHKKPIHYPTLHSCARGVMPVLRSMPMNNLLTATREKIIKDNANSNSILGEWITSVFYYNNEGEVIQVQRKVDRKISGGQLAYFYKDISNTLHDFKGRPLSTTRYHYDLEQFPSTATSEKITKIYTRFTYQPLSFKPVSTTQKIDNGNWMLLSTYTYDPLTGVVSNKNLGNVENQAYTYNIRGNLTSINKAYVENGIALPKVTFGESIKYDYGFQQKRYDGLISGILWKTPSTPVRSYGYEYDTFQQIAKCRFL